VRASAMTMDLYGHLVDDRLWEAARAVGGILGVTFGGKWQEIFAAISPLSRRDRSRGRLATLSSPGWALLIIVSKPAVHHAAPY
jgi:hypothetical protein